MVKKSTIRFQFQELLNSLLNPRRSIMGSMERGVESGFTIQAMVPVGTRFLETKDILTLTSLAKMLQSCLPPMMDILCGMMEDIPHILVMLGQRHSHLPSVTFRPRLSTLRPTLTGCPDFPRSSWNTIGRMGIDRRKRRVLRQGASVLLCFPVVRVLSSTLLPVLRRP